MNIQYLANRGSSASVEPHHQRGESDEEGIRTARILRRWPRRRTSYAARMGEAVMRRCRRREEERREGMREGEE
jgi:hypothetical protein